ncbi:hypothetical protein Tco_0855755 [Tanacetum coccineum]|uniref:Uncharacterized protein n=1 Tax=Tanacetum coccineum TaxID=301880 RepID=A0ABQ4WDJ4_9ASTR
MTYSCYHEGMIAPKWISLSTLCSEPGTTIEIFELFPNIRKLIHNNIRLLRSKKEQEEKSITELLAEERFQKANQALNESQSPQEMRILDLEIQKQQCLEEMKEWMNDLGRKDNIKGGDSNRLYKKCEDNL